MTQRAVKLFKENAGGRGEQQLTTPTPNSHRSGIASAIPPASAATKLLQSSGMASVSAQQASSANPSSKANDNDDEIDKKNSQTQANESALNDSELCISDVQGIKPICSSSPVQSSKTRSHNELRSSMPEADRLPTMSTRMLADRNCGRGNVSGAESSEFSASPFSRSLNLTPSSSEQSLLHSIKTSEKLASVLSKPYTNSMKNGSTYKSRSRHWECRFHKIRNRRSYCRLLTFFKIEKPALGVPAIEIFLKTGVVNAGHCHMYPNALVWLYF